jgi:hypothetical protein
MFIAVSASAAEVAPIMGQAYLGLLILILEHVLME